MKIFLAFFWLALSATAAAADTVKLPKEFLGPWCYSPDFNVYKRGRCSEKVRDLVGDMHDITIRANGYDYYEAECRPVKSVRRSNGAYVMTYRCMSEENNGILKKTLYLDQEQLFILDHH